ncbi:hypothetical protein [Chelativorans sp. J32]|uniref:hypothetical protein n=1 Tax=Chelativorans sp. J32 TaxID=935840 RepID=UPI0004853DF9|nr:hypothetical protein [Chelativorans sp. J32]
MLAIKKPVTIRYRSADTLPPVAAGEMETFIVVTANSAGEMHCFAADYLNDFPLWSEPPVLQENPFVRADGCNATGWFDHLPDEENGAIISPLKLVEGQRIVGWAPVSEMIPKP